MVALGGIVVIQSWMGGAPPPCLIHAPRGEALGTLVSSGRSVVGRIARDLPGGEEAIRTSGDDALRVLSVRRSMQDLAEGRTVELDGWILARTEARLCALSSIL